MPHPISAASLFDLNATALASLFDGTTYAWEVIPRIGELIAAQFAQGLPIFSAEKRTAYHPSTHFGDKPIYIGENVTIEPGVYIEGPAIIHNGAMLRHGAYVRANVILAPGAMVGHATEIKNTIMLEDAHAPHFAYLGDSILGQRVNLGAGTKLSNLAVSSATDPATGKRPTIQIPFQGERLDTGLTKFGAVLGDDVQIGCNAVTNPGTVIGARTWVYAVASLAKGYYPSDSVIKLRQNVEIIEKRR
jgi:UDP-N-acetylglucosamine diphosphorylase / glucose-1-phosphate thymidylyltransferase / UDP-N-acetylgalactosamine diphosphorylase / glucosamine-1-phosphate N-acetyltransferase / galactosamine-1-phosphate N-acetyltransferase